MSAVPHEGMPGLLAAALARVDDFFFEKVTEPAAPARPATHPAVVVAGLGRRVGATTLARALAVELAAERGGTIVATDSVPARAAPASRGARRIAVAFGDRPLRVTGRLCIVEASAPTPAAPSPAATAAAPSFAATAAAARYLAPLVVDWPYGVPVADSLAIGAPVVLVATPGTDAALAATVAGTVGGATLVLNRERSLEEWDCLPDVTVPDARVHARLALAGRPAGGRFGAAIAALAGRVA